jgi:DNA polymerase III gamma/tau subunit
LGQAVKQSKYDIRAAKRRIAELEMMYCRLKQKQPEDGTWDWWIMAQIDELEREIEEAQKRMTTVSGSGHSNVKQNLITPIIPAWEQRGKEVTGA